ncbi:cytoplasmic tRNA 2-thiolation protein 1 isoform X2 [Engystomops pustulosus]|uniref:cytoplasmic tRNA 2-thiolation protein 1 isoform X2 n=1 Tax=Engystomops pustulosus TaxID=76066 RepID=UPI003AFA5D2C
MSLLPLADGFADTTQTGSNSSAEITIEFQPESPPPPCGVGGSHPSEEGHSLPITPIVDNERVTAGPYAFGSPAWCFFGVPGGSSNIQRELVVTCKLCRAQVRRGINPGKVGTTCLFTHLERRHGMTRQEVFEQAKASGYSGPNMTSAALSSEYVDGGGILHSRAATKRPGVSHSSSSGEDEVEPKRQATMAPATSSGPSTTSSSPKDKPNHSGTRSSAYRLALRERLLGSVHMFCEVCHSLVLSGERSQSVRDLALETHFSTNHPQMFRLLKSGAARDVRLGGLGPFTTVPSGSLPFSGQR